MPKNGREKKICAGRTLQRGREIKLPFAEFSSDRMWRRSDAERRCKACLRHGCETKVCAGCTVKQGREIKLPFEDFPSDRMWRRPDAERQCKECIRYGRERKPCSICGQKLRREEFASDRQWLNVGGDERKCAKCRKERSKPGQWSCIQCKLVFPQSEFFEVARSGESAQRQNLPL